MPASVQFIIGRAGSGKTHAVKAALKERMQQGRRAVLIVPEQFTFETERALCAELNGLIGVQVLSFARLSERILGGSERPFLSMQGRRMVVRRMAYVHRDELIAYGAVARRAGFAGRMDALLAQCKRFLITPDMLREAAGKLEAHTPLYAKLSDIATLYAAVEEYLAGRYMDSEDALNALVTALPRSFLRGADVYIDGFDSPTAQFYNILEALMRVCGTLTVTVCMDPDEDARDAALFAPERRAYERLVAMAWELGCMPKTQPLSSLPPPSGKHPALVRLEQELYAYPPHPYQGRQDAITLTGAADRAAEVEALADSVVALARTGVRYRDMAVIASDMPAYASAVRRAFLKRGIPLFMDARRSMQGHPLIELLLCAGRVAAGGINRTELLRIAKTGLAGVAAPDAEEFENYCLKRGLLYGKSFETTFPGEEEGAERARTALLAPLLRLRERFTGSAQNMTQALYDYLVALDVERRLLEEVQTLRDAGRFALMEEHAQVWDILLELFGQMHAILGDSAMSKKEYLEVLTEALAAYQVGVIPATADQVLFGDIDRTRSRAVHALFLLGCNEGLLPAARMDEGIIDDAELTALSDMGLAPWGSTQYRAEEERLSIYRALCCANEKLWVGFAYADGARELVPSTLADRLHEIFPDLKEQPALPDGALPETPQSGFAQLSRGRERANEPLYAALRAYYETDAFYGARLRQADGFATQPAAPVSLGAPLARALYGRRYFGTVSRLETYRSCPFRHFAQYGLKALPRKEFREKKADIGSFSHKALERFVRTAQERNLDWAAITREECDALLDELLPDCLKTYQDGLLCATARARALSVFWQEAVRETAWALCTGLAAGEFRPVGTELRFGPGEALPAVELGGTASLSGIIDRIDAAALPDGSKLIRVVDYKTGSLDFKFDKLRDGLSLQLPLYLCAAASHMEGAPAGLFYQPVRDPLAEDANAVADEADAPEEDAEAGCTAASPALKLRGVLIDEEEAVLATERTLSGGSAVMQGLRRNKNNALGKTDRLLTQKEMELLLSFAVERAGEITQELLGGRVEARPVRAGKDTVCAWCDYKSVCRFDKRLPGCRVRRVKKCTREKFFEQLVKDGGDAHGLDD